MWHTLITKKKEHNIIIGTCIMYNIKVKNITCNDLNQHKSFLPLMSRKRRIIGSGRNIIF